MPTPSRTSSYPPAMLLALEHARTHGSFVIPSLTARALRLKFYGLRSALKKENRDDFGDLNFLIRENTLVIQSADCSDLNREISAALAAQPINTSAPALEDDAEAVLKRLGF